MITNEEARELSAQIEELRNKLNPRTPRAPVKYKNKAITIKKPKISPDFASKTVLTDSTWQYVEIYLRSQDQDDALFYWEQARNFYESTKDLSIVSKPLTAYYCFLNATKALLEVKGIGYDLAHGVSGKREDGHINIINEIVRFQPVGVVSALGHYLGEHTPAGGETFNLKDIFYNIPYIHRAFKLTYSNMAELFIPIIEPRFVHDKTRKKAWLEIKLEPEHSNKTTLGRLVGYSLDKRYDNSFAYTLRRNKQFAWDAPRNNPSADSLANLNSYHKKIRRELTRISHDRINKNG